MSSMSFASVCMQSLLFCSHAFATSLTSSLTTSATVIPTASPIPGDYTGALRPQIHYSPPIHFMNDPNGMFRDANGTWHLYYQYNPLQNVAGNQHWGHATSKDLYHWINQKIAIFPANSTSLIFSGSAVVDTNNTSGFFPNQDNGVVAIYTVSQTLPNALQVQSISYSRDGGYTFVPYSANPVLNVGSAGFRDPQVFRYGNHWVMVVSYASEFTIGVFTSSNLKTWSHASNFSHVGLLGLQYECPNLVELAVENSTDTKWILQISINPGAPLGGSISQSFIGEFDGYTFTPLDKITRLDDFAKDNYAGQYFSGLPTGEAVSIAWASNWQYANDVPTGNIENWRSCMTLPRQNSIRDMERIGLTVVSKPYNLTPVIGRKLASNTNLLNSTLAVDYSDVTSQAVYIIVNITNIPTANISSYASLNFTAMSPVSGEYLRGGYFISNNNDLWINRGGIRGYDNIFMTNQFSTGDLPVGSYRFEAVIDRSIVEVFGNDGAHSGTALFFPEQPLSLLSVATANMPPSIKVSAAVYAVNSAWAQYENEDGIVVGNVTGGNYRRHPKVLYEAEF